jgi:carbamoylphosphate synthase large subunit
MAERLEFREKLAGILTLCESQNNITDKATVEAYFAEDNLFFCNIMRIPGSKDQKADASLLARGFLTS